MPDALTKAFYDKGKVILVRPMGDTISLGAVGYFDKGQWVPVTNTKQMFGITLVTPPVQNPRPNNSFDARNGKKLKVEFKANGETSDLIKDVAKASARVEIAFGSEDAFVMNVRNQSVATVADLNDLMKAIRVAYRDRNILEQGKFWDRKYAVVVGIASADSVAVFKSSGKDSRIAVGAAGTATGDLAKLDGSAELLYSSESVEQLKQAPVDGYAFRAIRIEPGIFTRWDREKIGVVTPDRGFNLGRSAKVAAKSKADDFDPGSVLVTELTPSGRALNPVKLRDLGPVSRASGRSRPAARARVNPKKSAPRGKVASKKKVASRKARGARKKSR